MRYIFTSVVCFFLFTFTQNIFSQEYPGDFIPETAAEIIQFGTDGWTSIEGDLIIDDVLLYSFNGFQNLESIGGNLEIKNNSELRNVNDFSNLTSIGGNVFVNNNNALTNLYGLHYLKTVNGNFTVTGNQRLSACCFLLDFTYNSLIIKNNAPLCSDINELKEVCNSCKNYIPISLVLSNTNSPVPDLNEDGEIDESEVAAFMPELKFRMNSLYQITNEYFAPIGIAFFIEDYYTLGQTPPSTGTIRHYINGVSGSGSGTYLWGIGVPYSDSSSMLLHELGHVLGLKHPHNAGSDHYCGELDVRPEEEQGQLYAANCAFMGDLLCGTDADYAWGNGNCGGTTHDLNGDLLTDNIRGSFMAYNNIDYLFTEDQYALMEETKNLALHRTFSNTISPFDFDLVKADFNVDIDSFDAVFTPNIISGEGPYKFIWDFGDGTTSYLKNPKHAYIEPGRYKVSLLINNEYSCYTYSQWVSINNNQSIYYFQDFNDEGSLYDFEINESSIDFYTPRRGYHNFSDYAVVFNELFSSFELNGNPPFSEPSEDTEIYDELKLILNNPTPSDYYLLSFDLLPVRVTHNKFQVLVNGDTLFNQVLNDPFHITDNANYAELMESGWHHIELDLSNYAESPQIEIEFRVVYSLESNGNRFHHVYLLDNVGVRGRETCTPKPTSFTRCYTVYNSLEKQPEKRFYWEYVDGMSYEYRYKSISTSCGGSQETLPQIIPTTDNYAVITNINETTSLEVRTVCPISGEKSDWSTPWCIYDVKCPSILQDIENDKDPSYSMKSVNDAQRERISDFINIYPNPTKDRITIDFKNLESFDGITELELYDLNGKLLIHKENINSTSLALNLNNVLSKGIYFVHIKKGNQVFQEKFILM